MMVLLGINAVHAEDQNYASSSSIAVAAAPAAAKTSVLKSLHNQAPHVSGSSSASRASTDAPAWV
jgi:hypothetical protein